MDLQISGLEMMGQLSIAQTINSTITHTNPMGTAPNFIHLVSIPFIVWTFKENFSEDENV
jgi:hypothetical protein